jgi:hypothetical protein
MDTKNDTGSFREQLELSLLSSSTKRRISELNAIRDKIQEDGWCVYSSIVAFILMNLRIETNRTSSCL